MPILVLVAEQSCVLFIVFIDKLYLKKLQDRILLKEARTLFFVSIIGRLAKTNDYELSPACAEASAGRQIRKPA